MTTRLHVDHATIGYGDRTVIQDLDLTVPDGSFTVIIGPNACGKSTLLRSMARLLRPSTGTVTLDGADLSSLSSRSIARSLGLLPQSAIAPDGIRVGDLVARGRFPHRGFLTRNTPHDLRVIAQALEATGTSDLADRLVDELSGGQRQRVWIAMVLAQETPLLLLDEPTTYLDIAHQISVLNLCADLHRQGRTVVAVLHDLNHACRYATHIVAMKDGRIVARGAPADIIDAALVQEVFDLPAIVIDDPVTGTPLVLPAAS
ncbi:ABC transporter ATP-binding protein [Brachybacterium alimentarium]|uniref:ABC transporter ATP-binding protein n=1 Tax=Brachybacterium alimentarium TaxID=47845 RepID=UPI000DF17CF7|nr:ABC transporter ATP-binding protein [Brachybacterium alimentarium]RCS66069.1 ABC transporter ATP-binding protein [Brachybacterium alimentarium]RCS77950.1 ABC transporter ATP-binding protein [Brachybacterium alimentarium]RCS84860.1 ABC transporter ATP-binding protein [Brachybacterium alimentarium]